MTGTLCVQWTLIPAQTPRPWRHCATCGATKAFISSGKVRLNANGRRLDAWLIYRCVDCDRTWLRPLFERVAVDQIPQTDLEAMQHSTPAWVRRHEFDVSALGRETEKFTHGDACTVTKPVRRPLLERPTAIELSLVAEAATGLRLDRFLSAELPISRSRLRSAHARGGVLVGASDEATLRRKINGDFTITLLAEAFSDAEFSSVCAAVFAD